MFDMFFCCTLFEIYFYLKFQLKILDQQKQVIIEQNRNFAEENMNKEPELIERKSRISELSEQGKSFCQNIQEQLNELSRW